ADFSRGRSRPEWLREKTGLPDPIGLIEVADSDGDRWIMLEGRYVWEEPAPRGGEMTLHGRLWYHVGGYLGRAPDAEKLRRWAAKQDFSEVRMPEPLDDVGNVFAGELYWSPAYRRTVTSERPDAAWENEAFGSDGLPVP